MTTNGAATAQVQVLTAEVRVLMVGSRQVTLSVYRQLDIVDPDQIEPFGRVSDRQNATPGFGNDRVHVVGRGPDGSLARSMRSRPHSEEQIRSIAASEEAQADEDAEHAASLERAAQSDGLDYWQRQALTHRAEERRHLAAAQQWLDFIPVAAAATVEYERWQQLPLIVLAGLR